TPSRTKRFAAVCELLAWLSNPRLRCPTNRCRAVSAPVLTRNHALASALAPGLRRLPPDARAVAHFLFQVLLHALEALQFPATFLHQVLQHVATLLQHVLQIVLQILVFCL